MPKDQRGKNRKYKHHKEKQFTPLTQQQIERAQKIARGEKVEDEQQVPEVVEKQQSKYKARQLKQARNYDIPPPEDSDEG